MSIPMIQSQSPQNTQLIQAFCLKAFGEGWGERSKFAVCFLPCILSIAMCSKVPQTSQPLNMTSKNSRMKETFAWFPSNVFYSVTMYKYSTFKKGYIIKDQNEL